MSAPMLEQLSLHLGPELAGTLMSPDEFDSATDYEEGFLYELVHGVLVVNPLPLPEETDPNEELGFWLRDYWQRNPEVMDATMPQQYIRTATGRRIADRVIWLGLGRLPDPRKDVPTIAVEFVSRSRRDRQRDYIDKRQEYLAAGVAEYWIFDRFQRTLTVVTKGAKGPIDQVVTESEAFSPSSLPGFTIPLAKLFAVADRWADRQP